MVRRVLRLDTVQKQKVYYTYSKIVVARQDFVDSI